MVEDAATTGGSIEKATRPLGLRGIVVNHAICIIDRSDGARDYLAEYEIDLISLLTWDGENLYPTPSI